MDRPDHEELRRFEAAHLRHTGASKESLRQQISARQERVRGLFNETERPEARAFARMQFGRS